MHDPLLVDGLLRAFAEALRPLVRQMVSSGVPSSRAEALVRRVFIETADEEFAIDGQTQTDSRIAVLTGVHRKDVRRLRARRVGASPRSLRRDLGATLVARWLAERRATDRAGKPIAIPFRAARGLSFVALARATSRDLRPKSILDELVRIGAVERRGRNLVALRASAYVPVSGLAEKLAMLAEDPAELLETMRRNVFEPVAEGFLQRKVSFDNIGASALPAVRRKLQKLGEQTIVRVNRLLAVYDRDLNPRAPDGERSYASLAATTTNRATSSAEPELSLATPVRSVGDYVWVLFAVDAALVVAHFAFGGSATWNLDKERNVPTWFAGVQLVLIGLATVQIFAAEQSRLSRAFPPRRAWLLAAVFFSYLSLDETTVIHEGLFRNEIRDLLPPDSLWISLLPWQFVFGPFLLLAALLLLALFASRFARSPSLLRPALAGLACWAGAVFAEGLAKPLFMAGGWYSFEVAIEEGLELLGATLLLVAFTRYARSLDADGSSALEPGPDVRRFAAWAFGLIGFLAIATAIVAAVSLRNSAWLHRHSAGQLAKRGKHAEAVAAYREALARRPDDVDSLRGIARGLTRLGDHGVALASYDRALALRPADARLWNGKGVSLHELGRFAEAESAYREAVRVSPGYARAVANLGLALEKQGRREEAAAEYARALALDPHQSLAAKRSRRGGASQAPAEVRPSSP